MSLGDFIKNIKTEVKVIKGEETKDKLFKSQHDYPDRETALAAFQRSKSKLFNVNKWSDLPGISSGFKVYSAEGTPKASGMPVIGDFIYIDLPGPTPETWVKVIDLKDETEEAEFTVSPSHDPREKGEKAQEVEHFFADEATSTFRVELIGTTIFAYEIGKEEGINNEGKKAGGRQIINTLIAIGGWIAIQEMQWRKLTDYLVNKIEAEA